MKKVIRTVVAFSLAIIASASVSPFRNTVLNNIDDEKIVYAAEKENILQSGNIKYYVDDDGAHITFMMYSKEETVSIPSEIAGVPVTSIEDGAVQCSDTVKLYIPDTVKSIGEKALIYSHKLETIIGKAGSAAEGTSEMRGEHRDKNYSFVTLDSLPENERKLILEDAAALPEWIPKSFDEAAAFEEKFGRTHTGDGYVCVLFRKKEMEQFHAAYNSSPKKFNSNSKDFAKVSFEIPSGKTEEPGTIYEDGEYIVFIFRFKGADYISIIDYMNQKIYRFISDENGEPIETKPVAGDCDGNGQIEASDVLLFQKYMVMGNENTTMPFYYDMNDDGIINIADLCIIKDALLNIQ